MEQNKAGKKQLKINGSMLVLLCALGIVVGVFTFLNKNFFSYTIRTHSTSLSSVAIVCK